MRRALAALVVTAVAVVLLARYQTHPPPEPPPPARAAKAPARPGPGVKVGTGPLLTTPFSSIQVRAELTRGRLTGVRTLSLSGADAHTRSINARAEPLLRARRCARGARGSTRSRARRTRARAGSSRSRRRSGTRAVVERRRARDGDAGARARPRRRAGAALDGMFGWLRWVDATFSPFWRGSEIRRLARGALAPPTRTRSCARCSTAARRCARRPAARSTSATRAGWIPAAW